MSTLSVPGIRGVDHIHVFVADRAAAERWYQRVLGFSRIKEFECWAADGGPLMIQNAAGTVHLALFERPSEKCRSTIALGVDSAAFLAWRSHLAQVLPSAARLEDHQAAWSLYFSDPGGNPYEITTYEYQAVQQALAVRDA